ncbi:alpha beta fold family hydrolase-like protein [Limosilactobacillus frumenti DSM 13145]|uniref:Alpha beta fold family hydrolase-like protein n=1 Tax=Limosilactobacillus frumenti DSM 13145 TaxID=1423746 RepID=A0A0R1P6E6_9LACO|nr:alpha/beta hydrolase [Limosilactobacillus frumenti]KRL27804.1 alpha beta fold family hydrolase-like protein [Limosilactobacillus frumenti DSM 13145]MBA2914438.1 alpha/beta hydrolase [Limosilactobacillus frumenti]QFG73357.1 alpha/beta hydrolase [Limosilactobacillus frumenti]
MEVFIQRDGLKLHGLLEGTDQVQNSSVAILMHGFKGDLGYDNSQILYALSHYLNDHGIPTLRFDFDGSGKSTGRFEDMTVFSELLDGMKIIDYARTKMKAQHIYLIGHSQGGVVASMLAAYYRDVIEKLVLLAPAATLKDDALNGECQGSTYDPNHIPLSVNVHGFEVGGDYFRTAQLMPIYETAQHFAKPTLLIHGTDDQVVSPEASRKYNVILPQSELHLVPGEGHMFVGAQRPAILELVADFLNR